MKICIIGAGAIGGYMGIKFALAGEQVTLIARGRNRDAIVRNGLKLIDSEGNESIATQLKVTDKIREAGAQDLVILAVKAHQVEDIAPDVAALLGPETLVITTQNGIPWWYFHKFAGEFEGRAINSVDPGQSIMKHIDVQRVIGCVVYPAAEMVEPGVVHHIEGNRFPLGELDGSKSERITRLTQVFTQAGMKSPILDDIRSEIWLKLWGNLSFNPISALTHATLVDICQFPLTRELAANMMREAQTIAEKLGVTFRVTLERRINGAEKVGKHKTSMLQDVEAGRAIELDALVGAVVEMGQLTGTPTPYISAVLACAKLLAKTMADEHIAIKGITAGTRYKVKDTI